MKTQPFQQPSLTTRPAPMRRFRAPVLGLIALVAVLTSLAYAIQGNPAQIQLTQSVLTQRGPDAATQGVNSYLQAHANRGSPIRPDAATQGVNSYLQAHANIAKAEAVDPAVASVTNYLSAHHVAKTQQVDAATQGVSGYLQAHANVAETSVADPGVASVSGYLRAHGIVLIAR
jgi:hypothetical protein